MTALVILLAVAAGLIWWVRHRAARLRRDAESREAKVLDALFAVRHSADSGGETIDLDQVFGDETAPIGRAVGSSAMLGSVAIDELPSTLSKSPSPDAIDFAAAMPNVAARPRRSAERSTEDFDQARALARAARTSSEAPAPVRDLVEVFYEARGYRSVPAARAARPIELVLRHQRDPERCYAFAPLADPVTRAVAQDLLQLAGVVDQSRVLIAAEVRVAPELSKALLAQGVRVLDRAAIEAQLTRLDSATAAKVRAVARQRADRRAQGTLG